MDLPVLVLEGWASGVVENLLRGRCRCWVLQTSVEQRSAGAFLFSQGASGGA